MCVCVSHHCPIDGVVEPLQQLDGGALPTAAAPHQGQSLALLHTQIEPLQDGHVGARWIVKLNPLKGHITIKLVLDEEKERIGLNAAFLTRCSVKRALCRVPDALPPLTDYRWQALCSAAS